MADVLTFFMAPADEVAFFRSLEPLGLTLFPEIIPATYTAPAVTGALAGQLDGPCYYLAAETLAPVELRAIERGPHRGALDIDEVRSPVIHLERSALAGDELRAGRVWAELVVSGDTQRNVGKSEAFRQLFARVREILGRYRRSQPVGALIGPAAARLHRTGLRLRGAGRHGGLFRPFR